MKSLFILLCNFMLVACQTSDKEDLQQFVLQATLKASIEDIGIKVVQSNEPLAFTQQQGRAPFLKAPQNMFFEQVDVVKSCLQPVFNRPKEALELFSLKQLNMRGNLQLDRQHWAIIEDPDGFFHRVKVGGYLGLEYGKVFAITDTHITLFELISDQKGCWQKRMVEINLLLK